MTTHKHPNITGPEYDDITSTRARDNVLKATTVPSRFLTMAITIDRFEDSKLLGGGGGGEAKAGRRSGVRGDDEAA